MNISEESILSVKTITSVKSYQSGKIIKVQDWLSIISSSERSKICGFKFFEGIVTGYRFGTVILGINDLVFLIDFEFMDRERSINYLIPLKDIKSCLQFYKYVVKNYPKYITSIFSNIYLSNQIRYL